jgi:2-polyprenyl-3-methyl-5-hydroxy-6-metoxy-1,4-benzoquinol methylase
MSREGSQASKSLAMSKYSENMPPDLKDAVGWMFDHIEDNKVFLDFGCSTGYFGNLIKKAKNNKVFGVEISEDVKEARKVLDGVYVFDLDGEWPKEIYEQKYDYLFFGDIIEHLKDPQKALEKARALLKEDGLVFISTPNVAHISVRLELMGGNFEYEPMGILDSTHLKYFTKKSLTKLVQEAGYNLKSIDFSANDYPNNVIEGILAKEGLQPTEKFWKMINKPEARAFQYKLILEPKTVETLKSDDVPKIKTPSEKPESIRNAAMTDLEQKVENLQNHAKEQAEIIKHYVSKSKELEDNNANLQGKLKRIESSRVYKVARSLKKTIGK